MEETRVDRWLWAVRVYKTRALATQACKGGHVRVNGAPARPATTVRPGDRVAAFAGRERVLEVLAVVTVRGSATVAARCFADHSPPAPPRELAAPGPAWGPGTGRPTKKDRRQTDRLRGR